VYPPLGVFVGLATLDVVHHAASRPGPDEKVTAQRQFVAAGGPAANAAVTFAALGGRARLVTALGSGPVGSIVRAELASRGVEVTDVDPEGAREPAVSAILVDPAAGTRSVVSLDAAGSDASSSLDHVTGADVVLLDGHHHHLAVAAARAAARAGVDVIVDAGRWKSAFSDLIPYATAMLCSAAFRLPDDEQDDEQDDERDAETDDEPVDERVTEQDDEQLASVARLLARGVSLVVTTHGPEPVRWWTGGRSGTIDVPPLPAVDTLGAGDAFHGAYAFAATRTSDDPLASLRFAVHIAGLKCASAGPRAWLDSLPRRVSPGPGGLA
jgi:sugar/nucleoside kinase (ribokinase family)